MGRRLEISSTGCISRERAAVSKLTPRIVLGAWSLWVLYRFVVFLTESASRPSGSALLWAASIGAFLVPAIGCALAWRLYVRPRKGIAVWFVVFCLILLWKFWLGGILLSVRPSIIGSQTLYEAFRNWWTAVTSSLRAAATLLSLVLVLFSLVYWPAYCMRRKMRIEALDGAAALGDGRAVCAECGGIFGIADMIRYDNLRVCAGCKPAFLQKLREGAEPQTGTKP